MQRLNREALLEDEGCRRSLLVERDLVGKELCRGHCPILVPQSLTGDLILAGGYEKTKSDMRGAAQVHS
jgi:hypothetical protein